MSWSWALVRGSSVNPTSLKFAALLNKQNTAENELFTPESNKPNILSVNTDDLVLLQDPFHFQKLTSKTTHFRGPFEPDGVILKYWCMFDHIARKMKDHSFSGNFTYPVGEPQLCEGPDDGIKGGNIITKINNGHQGDYFYTPSTSDLLSSVSNGFSIYLAFIPDSVDSADGEYDATLHYKYDDSNNLRSITLKPDGRIIFWVKKSGTNYVYESPANTINAKNLYRCCFTFNPSDNSEQMRINNSIPTDSGNSTVTSSSGTTDMVHGRRGAIDGGYFQGRIIDSRFYKGKVFESGHMDNIWYNGRSIGAAYAPDFNNGNQYLNLGVETGLWSQSKSKWSSTFWVRFDNDNDCTIGGSTGWGSVNGSVLFWRFLGTIGFGVWSGGEQDAWEEFYDLTGDRIWHHCGCTYDSTLGSANLKFYFDAAPGDVTGNATTTNNANDTMRLGGWTSGGLDGNVRDWRWYVNRVLTQTEVEKIRDNRSDAPVPDYWLKLGEANSDPVDFITATKTAIRTNGVSWRLTTSPWPLQFGSIAVAGYSFFHDTLYDVGYDSTGYDSTGYDTA